MIRLVDKTLSRIQRHGTFEEVRILKRNIRYMTILTIFFWLSALITGNLMCINSFIQSFIYEPKFTFDESLNATVAASIEPHILRSWFPVDKWTYFYVLYAVQFYIMWVGMVIVPCWHAFIVALMIFAVVLLMILKHRVANLEKYVSDERKISEYVEKNKELRCKFLRKCIDDQKFILE
jgi:gustatory receptor